MNHWTIENYKTANHHDVIDEWLNSLEEKPRAKVIDQIRRLKEKGIKLKEPHVKHIEGKLYELRTKDPKGVYRIIYFAYKGKKFVLLNGFTKKTKKTPKNEIEKAKGRLKDYINRFENGESDG